MRSNFHYHQPLPTGSRLLQYSLEEFSQPQLSLTIRKAVSRTRTPPLGVGWWFILTWAILSIICLWMYNMRLDMRQSAIASDNYFSLIDSWTDVPFIMTTTIHDNTATRRWSGNSCEDSGETIPVDMWSTSRPSPSPTATDVPPPTVTTRLPEWTSFSAQSSLPWQRAEKDALVDESSGSILENYDLVSFHNIFTSWWSDQHKYVAKHVLEKLIDTMEVIWSVFRKVYHYPLDPP